jgi:hypothetical protein
LQSESEKEGGFFHGDGHFRGGVMNQTLPEATPGELESFVFSLEKPLFLQDIFLAKRIPLNTDAIVTIF